MRAFSQLLSKDPVKHVNESLANAIQPILRKLQIRIQEEHGLRKSDIGKMISTSLITVGRNGLQQNNFNAGGKLLPSKIDLTGKAVSPLQENGVCQSFAQAFIDGLGNPRLVLTSGHALSSHFVSSRPAMGNKSENSLKIHVHDDAGRGGITISYLGDQGHSVSASDWPKHGDDPRLSITEADIHFFFSNPSKMASGLAVSGPHLKKNSLVLSATPAYPLSLIKQTLKRPDLELVRILSTVSSDIITFFAPNISDKNKMLLTECFKDKLIFWMDKEKQFEVATVYMSSFQSIIYPLLDSTAFMLRKDFAIPEKITMRVLLQMLESMGNFLLANKTYEDFEQLEFSVNNTELALRIVKEIESEFLAVLEDNTRKIPGSSTLFYRPVLDIPAKDGPGDFNSLGHFEHPSSPKLN